MTYTFIAQVCPDLPVATCCRVMKVSTSGFYAWRVHPVSDKDLDDAYLTNTIVDIHAMSRRSYSSPRVHAELRLGQDVRCSRKRVERLMREAKVTGIYRRRGRGCTRRDLGAQPSDDLVERNFDPDGPDRLWVMDVTEHPTRAPRRAPLDEPPTSCPRRLRLDRDLVQPQASPQLLPDAQSRRLRTSQRRRSCGMINTTNLSAGAGEAHNPSTEEIAGNLLQAQANLVKAAKKEVTDRT
jgi:hypothetical protein